MKSVNWVQYLKVWTAIQDRGFWWDSVFTWGPRVNLIIRKKFKIQLSFGEGTGRVRDSIKNHNVNQAY